MAFFTNAIDVLQTLVIALGAGLGVWGVINLLEGYGNDNPGAKSQGKMVIIAKYTVLTGEYLRYIASHILKTSQQYLAIIYKSLHGQAIAVKRMAKIHTTTN